MLIFNVLYLKWIGVSGLGQVIIIPLLKIMSECGGVGFFDVTFMRHQSMLKKCTI